MTTTTTRATRISSAARVRAARGSHRMAVPPSCTSWRARCRGRAARRLRSKRAQIPLRTNHHSLTGVLLVRVRVAVGEDEDDLGEDDDDDLGSLGEDDDGGGGLGDLGESDLGEDGEEGDDGEEGEDGDDGEEGDEEADEEEEESGAEEEAAGPGAKRQRR